jgi:predicted anti-sigma-YlaC factor YlaD
MRCDEIREHLIDLLYNEPAASEGDAALRDHIGSCPDCRRELEGLRDVRRMLSSWEDERPARPLRVPARIDAYRRRPPLVSRALKYAAIAAMVLLAFLGLTNAEITWNDQGFAFKSRLTGGKAPLSDTYSRAELQEFLRRALDDTEARMIETNRLMILQGLDTSEAERYRDFQLIEHRLTKGLNKN